MAVAVGATLLALIGLGFLMNSPLTMLVGVGLLVVATVIGLLLGVLK